jgi:hypothetical protein
VLTHVGSLHLNASLQNSTMRKIPLRTKILGSFRYIFQFCKLTFLRTLVKIQTQVLNRKMEEKDQTESTTLLLPGQLAHLTEKSESLLCVVPASVGLLSRIASETQP